MGGDELDRVEDRVHWRDAAPVGAAGRARPGSSRRHDDRGAGPAQGRDGTTTEERDRLKALEREVRELRQANEILRKASAYFAQAELDRPFKR